MKRRVFIDTNIVSYDEDFEPFSEYYTQGEFIEETGTEPSPTDY